MIVRSKELWVEQDEKPTKYFFQFSEKKTAEKEVTELNSRTGVLPSDSEDNFYQDLFSEEEVDLEAQDWHVPR